MYWEPAVSQTHGWSTTQYKAEATLWDEGTCFYGGTFLLPSEFPQADWDSYIVDLDAKTGVRHVICSQLTPREDVFASISATFRGSSQASGSSHFFMSALSRQQSGDKPSQIEPQKQNASSLQDLDPSILSFGPSQIMPQLQNTDDLQALDPSILSFGLSKTAKIEAQKTTLPSSTSILNSIFSNGHVNLSAKSEVVDKTTRSSPYMHSKGQIDPFAVVDPVVARKGYQMRASELEVNTKLLFAQRSGPSTAQTPGFSPESAQTTKSTPATSPALSPKFLLLRDLPEVPAAAGKPTKTFDALNVPERENQFDECEDFPSPWLNVELSFKQAENWLDIQARMESEDSVPRSYIPVAALTSTSDLTSPDHMVLRKSVSERLSTVHLSLAEKVEALPSFDINTKDLSRDFYALDVSSTESLGRSDGTQDHLDLASASHLEQHSKHIAPFEPILAAPEAANDVHIAIDEASGQLYLVPVYNDALQTLGLDGVREGHPPQTPEQSNTVKPVMRFEDINLDAVFGQSATDLDDERDFPDQSRSINADPVLQVEDVNLHAETGQPANNSDDESFDSCSELLTVDYHQIGSRLHLRHMIPAGAADWVEKQIQSKPNEDPLLIQANEYWEYLKENFARKDVPRRLLKKRRNPASVMSKLMGLEHNCKPVEPVEEQANPDRRWIRPIHHYNLLNTPIHHGSHTPSAVSFWAVLASDYKEPVEDGASWKAVVSAQAAKLVDPCIFTSEEATPLSLYEEVNATKLRNYLTGLTTVCYEPQGAWLSDPYDPDQEAPQIISSWARRVLDDDAYAHYGYQGLQRPYFVAKNDLDVMGGVAYGGPYSCSGLDRIQLKKLSSRGNTNLRYRMDANSPESSLVASPKAFIGDEDVEENPAFDQDEGSKDAKPALSTVPAAPGLSGSGLDDLSLANVEEDVSEANVEDDISHADTDILEGPKPERMPAEDLGSGQYILNALLGISAAEPEPIDVLNQGEVPSKSPAANIPEDLVADLFVDAIVLMAKIKAHRPACMARYTSDDESSEVSSEDADWEADKQADYFHTWPKHLSPAAHPKAEGLSIWADEVVSEICVTHQIDREAESSVEQSDAAFLAQWAEQRDDNENSDTENWDNDVEDFDSDDVEKYLDPDTFPQFADRNASYASNEGELEADAYSQESPEQSKSLTALQNGRHTSPTKMDQSRMGHVHTPSQSPSKDCDYGCWESDGEGGFLSPSQSSPGQASSTARNQETYCEDAFRAVASSMSVDESNNLARIVAGMRSNAGSGVSSDQGPATKSVAPSYSENENRLAPGYPVSSAILARVLDGVAASQRMEAAAKSARREVPQILLTGKSFDEDNVFGPGVISTQSEAETLADAEEATEQSQGTSEVGPAEESEDQEHQRLPKPASATLTTVEEGGLETDSNPIKAKRPIAMSRMRRVSQVSQSFSQFRSRHTLSSQPTQPQMSDADFRELLEDRLAQQLKKKLGNTTAWNSEFQENLIIPGPARSTQTGNTGGKFSNDTLATHSREPSGNITLKTSVSTTADKGVLLDEKIVDEEGKAELPDSFTIKPSIEEAPVVDDNALGLATSDEVIIITARPETPKSAGNVTSTIVSPGDILEAENSVDLPAGAAPAEGDIVEAENLIEYEYGDVSEIPDNRPNFNRAFYGDVAIAVGHATFGLGKWVLRKLW